MPANATTPDQLPSQPRKASWKRWTIALACVLAIFLALVYPTPPGPEPVSIRFVGVTNLYGQNRLAFKGKNRLAKPITYDVWAYRCNPAAIPTNLAAIGASSTRSANAGPGEAFTFDLAAPDDGPNWLATWSYHVAPHPLTRWEQTKFRCYVFLNRHHLSRVAHLFGSPPRIRYISPTDLKD